MTFLWLAVLALLAGSSSARPNRIVGGETTTIEKYPTLVQIDFMDSFTSVWNQNCAGSILNFRYVVSAAHCFDGIFYQPGWRRFRAGSTNRNSGGVITYVDAVFNHPSYGTYYNDGDISVIRLTPTLVYSPVIQPVTIVPQSSPIPDNLPVVHAGWGHTEQDGVSSEVLRDVQTSTINNNLCADRYATLGIPVTPNMICTGLLNVGGKDTCHGDSGGPLYYNDMLIGIISWGSGCGSGFFPGVSTNVASYTDWIVYVAV